MQNRKRRSNRGLLIFSLLIALIFNSSVHAQSQYRIHGQVLDRKTKEALPFAVVTYGTSGQGLLTDVNGYYDITTSQPITNLAVTHLGYRKRSFSISWKDSVQKLDLLLRNENRAIEQVIITPTVNPAVLLLERSLALKAQHDPATLPQYTYLNYSKLRASMRLDSSTLQDPDWPKFERFGDPSENRILFFLSESLTRHDHARGKLPVDVVLSTHTSGTKNPRVTYLSAMIQPSSFYEEEVILLGEKYINPYSTAGLRRYRYHIQDTILLSQGDSLFQISFSPRRLGENLLTGSLVIGSKELALEKIAVNGNGRDDFPLGYQLHHRYKVDPTTGRWFPDEYYVALRDSLTVLQIESITAVRDIKTTQIAPLKHSRRIAISYEPIPERERDSILELHKIEPLNVAETRTYELVDSIGEKYHFDKYLTFIEVLATGRIRIGYAQIVLNQIWGFNQFEGSRLGIGLETSDKVSQRFRLGGYYAYGFRDEGHKYGGNLLLRLNQENGLDLQLHYSNDLRPVGHTQDLMYISMLSTIPLNNIYRRRMDREVRYGATLTLHIPVHLQVACSYADNRNNSAWGYPQRLTDPYQLLHSRLTFSYAPNEQYTYFYNGLIPYRTAPYRMQLQIEHGVNTEAWQEQFVKGEVSIYGNWYSASYGHLLATAGSGIILGTYPLAYGYTNRGIGRKMDDVLVDGTSFTTIPSDKYYNDLYCHFHALYSTLPWQALSLGDLHLGLASMLNAAWGKQLRDYTRYGFDAPSFSNGIVEVGLGFTTLFTSGILPSRLTILGVYRALPSTPFKYKQNFGIGFCIAAGF